MKLLKKRYTFFIVGGTLFLLVGFSLLLEWSLTQTGRPVSHLQRWPAESRLKTQELLPTLLVFLHPKCSCSAATMSELERLVPELKDRLKVKLIFIQQPTRDIAWVKDGLWERSRRLPGVETLIDQSGREARLFGSTNSGHAYLFDEEGSLIFNGGLTSMRGHTGPSEGQDQLLNWLRTRKGKGFLSKIFGCGFFGRARGE